MADEKKVLTPEKIMHRLRFSLTEASDKEAIIQLIREYGEQQREDARQDGYGDGYMKGIEDAGIEI